jgi:hypothetical protein
MTDLERIESAIESTKTRIGKFEADIELAKNRGDYTEVSSIRGMLQQARLILVRLDQDKRAATPLGAVSGSAMFVGSSN